jgi:hypothetical protein
VGAVSFKSPLDGFSSLHEWYENEKRLFYQHVRPWIAIGAEMAKATGWRMTYRQYHWLIEFLDGMNSYESKVLLPVLDDLAVCELTEYCRSQCGRDLGELDLPSHYGDAVERELAPLLVKRLREADMDRGLLREASKANMREADRLVGEARKRADKLAEEMTSFVGHALTALEPVIGDPLKYKPELDPGNRVLAAIEEAVEWVKGLRTDTEGMRKALAGVAKRADEQHERAQTKWRENHELKGQLEEVVQDRQRWMDRANGAASLCQQAQDFSEVQLQKAEGLVGQLEEARKQSAAWEIQCQDLRDQLVQLRRELSIEQGIALDRQNQVRDLMIESAARYDCRGGPGFTKPACGGCITCLTRERDQLQAGLDRIESRLDAALAERGAR